MVFQFRQLSIIIAFFLFFSLLCTAAPKHSQAFPNIGDDSWVEVTPSSPILISSQSSIGYDPGTDRVFMWGGHLPGGGYPQLNEMFVYDVRSNSWSVQRPDSDVPPNYCVSADNVWDIANNVFVKFGAYKYGYFQWKRNFNLKSDVHLFDPFKNRWDFIFQIPGHFKISPAHNAVYDLNSQTIWFLNSNGNLGTWAYDTYSNTWSRELGWNGTPKDRPNAGFAFDHHNNKLVLFSGRNYEQRDLWVYDPVANHWEDRTPDHVPDVWTYDSAASKWILDTTYPPGPMANQILTTADVASVYDSANRVVLFFIPIDPPDPWQPRTGYEKNYGVSSTAYNGFVYTTSANGKSGDVEPDWPQKPGATVVDGTITWTCYGYIGERRLETWAYDVANNTWEKKRNAPGLNPSFRGGDINAVYMPEHNATMLVDLKRPDPRGARFFLYRYHNSSKPKAAPQNVSIHVDPGKATISWQQVPGAAGYSIYRGAGDPASPWKINYTRLNTGLRTTDYVDSSLSDQNTYFYYVTAQDLQGNESEPSTRVRTQPRIIREGNVSVLDANQVRINWEPVDNAVGYNVYRALCSVQTYPLNQNLGPAEMTYTRPTVKSATPGEFVKINESPIEGSQYLDAVSLAGGGGDYPYNVYGYMVKAVNALGVESGPSPYWLTIPSAPAHLNWTESWSKDSGTVKLQWRANPEAKLQGYRVYKMGPAYKYLMEELTTAPIPQTTFTHHLMAGASKNKQITYYVTAVDALGQEGIASDRALVNRTHQELFDQYQYLNDYYISDSLSDLPSPPTDLRVVSHSGTNSVNN